MNVLRRLLIKQDVGVLKKPGRQYEGQRQAHEAGLDGQREKHREDNQHARRSAAREAEQMGDDLQLRMRSFQQRRCQSVRLFGRWHQRSTNDSDQTIVGGWFLDESVFPYEAFLQNKCLEYVRFSGVISAPPKYGFTNRRPS